MSHFMPYGSIQPEYHPAQLVPPLPHHLQPPPVPLQPQLQLQPNTTQPSPQSNEQSINQSQAPVPPPLYPHPSPFEWVMSSITAILHSQHQNVLSKLNEVVSQQQALASKVTTLQERSDALHQTISTIQADLGGVSTKVARLGADMSSRDGTLAERLNALDDAIEAYIADGKMSTALVSGDRPELQTPPASDSQSIEPGARPKEPSLQPQQHGTGGQEAAVPDRTRLSTPPDRSSSMLSSLPQSSPLNATQDQRVTQASGPTPPSANLNGGNTQTRFGTHGDNKPSQAQLAKARRSARTPKKRKRPDGTDQPVSGKKTKGNTRVDEKAPRKRNVLPRFDWSSVPIRDEELEQIIYCDKCDHSYHWGCVNIAKDDPALTADTWWCPPCAFEKSHDAPVNHRARAALKDKCRPGCPIKDNSELFVISSIIGRFPHSADPSGNTMQYLIKWEDYPVQRATWTPENEIGQAAHALICTFEKTANNEELDVSDRSQLILLKEAKDAGWGYNSFPSW